MSVGGWEWTLRARTEACELLDQDKSSALSNDQKFSSVISVIDLTKSDAKEVARATARAEWLARVASQGAVVSPDVKGDFKSAEGQGDSGNEGDGATAVATGASADAAGTRRQAQMLAAAAKAAAAEVLAQVNNSTRPTAPKFSRANKIPNRPSLLSGVQLATNAPATPSMGQSSAPAKRQLRSTKANPKALGKAARKGASDAANTAAPQLPAAPQLDEEGTPALAPQPPEGAPPCRPVMLSAGLVPLQPAASASSDYSDVSDADEPTYAARGSAIGAGRSTVLAVTCVATEPAWPYPACFHSRISLASRRPRLQRLRIRAMRRARTQRLRIQVMRRVMSSKACHAGRLPRMPL